MGVLDTIRIVLEAGKEFLERQQIAEPLDDYINKFEHEGFNLIETRNNGFTAVLQKVTEPGWLDKTLGQSTKAETVYLYVTKNDRINAVMNVDFDPSDQATVFFCPHCSKKLFNVSPGNWTCAGCKGPFVISENGKISMAPESPDHEETVFNSRLETTRDALAKLECDTGSSKEAIIRKYHELLLKYHPDKNASLNIPEHLRLWIDEKAINEKSNKRTREIQTAYEYLKSIGYV